MLRMLFAALVIGLASTYPAHATSVLPLYLDELVDTAAVAFQGTVLDNRTEREAGSKLVVTYTTFAVSDVLKGTVAATHTIKQIGGELAGEGMSYRIQGVPKFVPGQDYVVFMAGVSEAGFSSPIGLVQGRFSIKREGMSSKVGNGRDFRDLTANIPSPQTAGTLVQKVQRAPVATHEVGLAEFKQLVRERAARAK